MKIKYNNYKKNLLKISYTLIVVCITFKFNNIFIVINQVIKFLELFKFNKLINSYSCGTTQLKNKNKMSLKAYNVLVTKVILWLYVNKITKIYLIVKSSSKINYIFLQLFINLLIKCKTINIINICIKLSIPSNGCKLQKRKFL